MALIAGVSALVFTYFPELKPFDPITKKGDLTVLGVERGVTRDQWRWRVAAGDRARHDTHVERDRIELDTSPFEACRVIGSQAGYVANVRSTAEGFKRRELSVRASLYAYPSRRRIETTELEEYRDLALVDVDAPTDSSIQQIWVYDPGTNRRYMIRIGLYDEDDGLLAISDSKPFLALRPGELRELASQKPRGC